MFWWWTERPLLKSCCTAGQALPNSASEWADFGFWGDTYLFIQLQFRAVVHTLPSPQSMTQAKLVSRGGAQSRALCRGKEYSLAAQILQMSETQGNKMVFPNGNHPTDLMCLSLNYYSHDKSFRAVCSYQTNYWFSNNIRGCITFWIIISSCAREGYTEITI